jgi:hypothetical protein
MASGNPAILLPVAKGIDLSSDITFLAFAGAGASPFRGQVWFLSAGRCATIAIPIPDKTKIAACTGRDPCSRCYCSGYSTT